MKTLKNLLFLFALLTLAGKATAQIQVNEPPVHSNPLYFSGNTGDKISMYDERLGDANNYGFGVGDYTHYAKSPGNFAWLQNAIVNPGDDQQDIYDKSIMHLTRSGGQGPFLTLREPTAYSPANSGEIRMLERSSGTSQYGGYMRYDGATNLMHLGMYNGGGKYSALTIARNTRYVGVLNEDPDYPLDVAGTANLNDGLNGVALRVNGDEALWFNGTYFSWGYGGSYNYFADRVGIGTSTPHPDYLLSVNGKIRAKEVRVESGWADFVFEADYVLPTLDSVETFIAENGHLPGIPSAAEIGQNGLDLGTIDAKMMQKIEELTLYVIELKKENDALKQMILNK